ncbi:hypothetical protein BLNAU_7447 [Blattamonas nauphoetae]|uniref:Uncharacterized protein n=1 Tax=Blattamonas nauphoetae TaxID=2049346 RepID=A0ABQ9Y1F7_9EUKA|nr:hypothetical protein BLNAU_7447 [Blattamonas nauphoetae]
MISFVLDPPLSRLSPPRSSRGLPSTSPIRQVHIEEGFGESAVSRFLDSPHLLLFIARSFCVSSALLLFSLSIDDISASNTPLSLTPSLSSSSSRNPTSPSSSIFTADAIHPISPSIHSSLSLFCFLFPIRKVNVLNSCSSSSSSFSESSQSFVAHSLPPLPPPARHHRQRQTEIA